MKTALSFLLTTLSFVSLHAGTLVSWDPEGLIYKGDNRIKPPVPWTEAIQAPNGETVGLVTIAPGVKVTAGLDLGAGFNPSRLNTAWGGVSADEHSKNSEEAERAGNFITFSVAPDSGHQLTLKSLDMNVLVRSGVELNYIWQYSIDGRNFTNITAAPLSIVGNFGRPGDKGQALAPVDLSAIPPLQSLKSPVTFRIIIWKTSGHAVTEPGFLFAIGRLPGEDLSIQGEATKSR